MNDEKHIEFSFIKRSISDQLFLKYFSTGIFLLDEDFIFAPEICEVLKIERCKLKQGKYKICLALIYSVLFLILHIF
ncbi:MAG: hypothetical protein WCO54_03770, partial [Bacteroidota bacterium]